MKLHRSGKLVLGEVTQNLLRATMLFGWLPGWWSGMCYLLCYLYVERSTKLIKLSQARMTGEKEVQLSLHQSGMMH